ncbi:hypothetical protein bhYOR_001191 (plasmid) [Borrelia nietonii YOR]|uniref:hypothetical protein n=1 Tax=Borrelia nietonii TaxID=3117462 RepID=UPI00046D8DCD|nr:hypothetical protein [Borrelia nietonii]UPA09880.1 hypothetical protein bhYOR_001191 [Borrelia nietonii YOR]
MKLSKIFVVLLSVLAFSCNLSDLLDRDGQGRGIGELFKGSLMAAKQGADYLVDALEDEDEYEYIYVDEDGNVVYVDYEGVAGYYPGAVNELEDKDGVDVSAGGVVVAKPGELAGSGDVKVASMPAESQEAVTVQATEVKQNEPSEKAAEKAEGKAEEKADKKEERKSRKQKCRRNRNRTTTSQTRAHLRVPVSSTSQKKVFYSSLTSSPGAVRCKSYYGSGGMVVVIPDEEKKLFGYLEKYLEDAIKVNGKSESEQRKYETVREKFFNWLKRNDTTSSFRRVELARAMKGVFDLIKSNARSSQEIQNWISQGKDKEILSQAGISSVSDLNSDAAVDALIKSSVSSRYYSGTSLSLFFQSLADIFANGNDYSDDSFDWIFRQMKSAFKGNSNLSDDFRALSSKVKG